MKIIRKLGENKTLIQPTGGHAVTVGHTVLELQRGQYSSLLGFFRTLDTCHSQYSLFVVSFIHSSVFDTQFHGITAPLPPLDYSQMPPSI